MATDSRRAPVRRDKAETPAEKASRPQEIDEFLAAARTMAPAETAGGRGRLIFALDATMSRQPTWDTAQKLQAEMFEEAAKVGGLEIQLVYYPWFQRVPRQPLGQRRARAARPDDRHRRAAAATPRSARILAHARKETGKKKVNVLVFVGDAMEEKVDDLAAVAGELGLLGVRVFIFQEGRDPIVERAFREIARLSGGAYAPLRRQLLRGQLAELLRAAAVYAAGGMKALAKGGAGARLLLQQTALAMAYLGAGIIVLAIVLAAWPGVHLGRSAPRRARHPLSARHCAGGRRRSRWRLPSAGASGWW